MALSRYKVEDYDGTSYEVLVGDGDRCRSFSDKPEDVAPVVRFAHILYVSARRAGSFTETFDEFQDHLGSFEALESGESMAPLDD